MNKKNIILYTVVSYTWSYVLWLIAIVYALNNNFELVLNESTPEALYSGRYIGTLAKMSLLALLATWGPLIGSLVISVIDKTFRTEFQSRLKLITNPKPYMVAVGLFVAIGLFPSIPLLLFNGLTDVSIMTGLLYFITFFLIQLVSSGFEEFGWRGFLLPEFLKKYDSWSACFYTGIIWALWHVPIVMYIFHLQGMPLFAMITSFFGFSVGIVAMSVVHFYFFSRTKSVLFSVFVHAIGNAIPLIAGLLIANASQVAILSQLLLWVVVVLIMKKNSDLFPPKPKKTS